MDVSCDDSVTRMVSPSNEWALRTNGKFVISPTTDMYLLQE